MTDRIVIFYGSKKDFEELVATETSKEQVTIPFMELIQHYNARLRPNESGVRESALSRNIDVDNCVVRADDYGSVLEHVLSNFVNVVTLNHDIGTLFVHNPPRKVRDSLRSAYGDDIEYLGTQYPDLSREKLKEVYSNIEKDILGQSNCKKQIISGMYRLIAKANNKPVVLMLYGPSGVGKTESAKSISKTMGGELLRIQFSMMQTTEAYNYVFGAEHSKGSFARDMMARESNVILIDEFDKVNPAFYNAFYELFDEGRYVDTNYDVNLGQAIFLLTCNFGSEEEIKKILPHRDHMLLIDEAELREGKAYGKKTIRGDEFFLQGHFPGNPVVPGVILCEILGQSACVLLSGEAEGITPFFTGLDKVRFKNPVHPGDVFETECTLLKHKGPFYWAEGKGYVDGKLCVSAEFSFALIKE